MTRWAWVTMCVVAGACAGEQAQSPPCNGHVALCARQVDQVAFAATHNAHAAQADGYGVFNANQVSGLAQQLADGVRALLMDVYELDGQSVFCHGPCQLGSTSHADGLQIVADFLDSHPREVVVILYEDHLAAERIEADLVSVGLDARVYTHDGGDWPTLGALIDADTRLIVTAENAGPPPTWLHHVWDQAWDTPYDFASADEFSCVLNRGSRDNALFLLNHWVGTELGLPSESAAMTVNTFDVLHARAQGCWDETGDMPNFIAVDFYEHGDLFSVVDALNGF